MIDHKQRIHDLEGIKLFKKICIKNVIFNLSSTYKQIYENATIVDINSEYNIKETNKCPAIIDFAIK
jgi:hypothetical protein